MWFKEAIIKVQRALSSRSAMAVDNSVLTPKAQHDCGKVENTYLDNIFNKQIAKTLKHEGGYVNNPSDKGGETNFGISKNSYPNLDIKNLKIEDAKAIYRRDFFDKLPFHLFNNEQLIAKLFDISVNMGLKRAIMTLQRALSACGFMSVDDGVVSSKTELACSKVDNQMLLIGLRAEQAAFYRTRANLDKSQMKFLKGWLNRAYDSEIV
jgi:lysozyme family protein